MRHEPKAQVADATAERMPARASNTFAERHLVSLPRRLFSRGTWSQSEIEYRCTVHSRAMGTHTSRTSMRPGNRRETNPTNLVDASKHGHEEAHERISRAFQSLARPLGHPVVRFLTGEGHPHHLFARSERFLVTRLLARSERFLGSCTPTQPVSGPGKNDSGHATPPRP